MGASPSHPKRRGLGVISRRKSSRTRTNNPAALSDDDFSDVGEFTIPTRSTRKSASSDAVSDANKDDVVVATNGNSADEGDEDDENDDADDLDDDVFVVEAIKKHTIDEDGTLKFQVKWEGYDKKKDLTWEPERNLVDTAEDILNAYYEEIGGREVIFEETEKASKSKKRRRAANGTPSSTKRSRRNGAHPSETTPPVTTKKWSPPAGSWEDEIETIDACEDEGSGKLIVYLIWKNGQKTKHDTAVIYKKCPQKAQMLYFYERHVKIIRDENKALADEAEISSVALHHLNPTTSQPPTVAAMKKNDVIAIIIIILFILLAAVSFGIWKLVSVAKKSMSVTSGTTSSTGSSNIVDA
ncbi:hypothetical protein QQZ08_011644 [Neonectria magnoliae]|uniref:Chromo domain-containing protein n=2 Tax=Neonectria TaxID=140106 RepID=A0ABR1H953_9HYPO